MRNARGLLTRLYLRQPSNDRISFAGSRNVAHAIGQQFDLVCTGETSFGAPSPVTPFNIRVRIDLDRNVWCQGSCGVAMPILDVNTGRILLEQRQLDEGGSYFTSLNRETGGYVSNLHDPTNGEHRTMLGTCTKATFTPIPGPQF